MLLAHSLKLKEGPVLVKRNKMFGSQFFLQVKYETDWLWATKTNENDDSFAPFKPSLYRNTIRKEN